MNDRNDPPAEASLTSRTDEPSAAQDAPRPDEFYTEGAYMVFTAAYHLRRGYCCNSDCRHCPYK